MTISKEAIEKTNKARLEHRRRMETDPEYREWAEKMIEALGPPIDKVQKKTSDASGDIQD